MRYRLLAQAPRPGSRYAVRESGTSGRFHLVSWGSGGANEFNYNPLPTGFPPDLFVPAYECAAGTVLPRSYVDGAPAPGLDVCDLARDPSLLPLTNPSAP
jgi:hypothetical protein